MSGAEFGMVWDICDRREITMLLAADPRPELTEIEAAERLGIKRAALPVGRNACPTS